MADTCPDCGGPGDAISFDRCECVCGTMHYRCDGCGRTVDDCELPTMESLENLRPEYRAWWNDLEGNLDDPYFRHEYVAQLMRMNTVTIDRDYLAILLGEAYRDISTGCVNYRADGCIQCQAFDAAEAAVGGMDYEDRNWFKRRGRDRWRRWREIRKWGKEARDDE